MSLVLLRGMGNHGSRDNEYGTYIIVLQWFLCRLFSGLGKLVRALTHQGACLLFLVPGSGENYT